MRCNIAHHTVCMRYLPTIIYMSRLQNIHTQDQMMRWIIIDKLEIVSSLKRKDDGSLAVVNKNLKLSVDDGVTME